MRSLALSTDLTGRHKVFGVRVHGGPPEMSPEKGQGPTPGWLVKREGWIHWWAYDWIVSGTNRRLGGPLVGSGWFFSASFTVALISQITAATTLDGRMEFWLGSSSSAEN